MVQDDDPVHVWLLRIYFGCLAIVWFYSLSRWRNLLIAVCLYCSGNEDDDHDDDHEDTGNEDKLVSIEEDLLPPVTVQILSYNEGEVVPTTIDKVCALQYPTDRLFVHVLDDSTDPSAAILVQEAVTRHAKQGVNISYKTRADRHGYKAGNLSYHFDDIQTDFVLYLDGDHQVQPDMLQRTIPLFYNNPKLALVQTPWGYYNSHANLLTEIDSIGLDIHHTIEQTARSHLFGVFGFNGTGGVWRKQAIADAGGWTWDTVTEDLAISYLAHLEGYTFRYLSDCPQMLELPRNLLAHIQQKQRWTKGFMQVFRLYYGRILFSKHSNIWTKLEAFMHFTGPISLIAAVVGILIFPHLVFHNIHTPVIESMSLFPILEPVCSALHAILTKTTVGDANYSATRIFVLLPYFALRFGMAPFELRAVCEGIFSNDATFHSTPKEGTQPKPRRDSTTKVPDGIKGRWENDLCAYGGLFLGLHQFLYVMIYDRRFGRSTLFELGIRTLNVLVCVGMIAVSASFLVQKHWLRWLKLDKRTRRIISRRTLFPLTIAACFLHGARMCMFHARQSHFKAPIKLGDFVETKAIEAISVSSNQTQKDAFLCLPPQSSQHPVHLRPLVVFAEPRSGSNLLFDMLGMHHPEVETLPLHEMFAPYKHNHWVQVEKIKEKTSKTCLIKRATPKANSTSRASSIYNTIDAVLGMRLQEPERVFDLLHSLPSLARHGYFAFKLFSVHLHNVNSETAFESPSAVIEMIRNHDPGTKFIVLWRRRMIESFVSYAMAMATGAWTAMATNATKAPESVHVDRKALETFIRGQQRYYLSVKKALEDEDVEYTLLEYSKNMLDDVSQHETRYTLEKILGAQGDSRANETMSYSLLKKQQQKELSDVVENWDEVVAWGYGGQVEEWEDLFAQ